MLTRKELIQRGADAMPRNRGETKNTFRKRQVKFVIHEYAKAGIRISRRQAGDVLRTSPARSKARIASTIHEYAPDRSRLRKKSKFVPRSVIAANQDAAISQLWQEILTLAERLRSRKSATERRRARNADKVGKTLPNAVRAVANRDGNESLLRDRFGKELDAYNRSTRQEYALKTPNSQRDWKLRVAIAYNNGGSFAAMRRMRFEAKLMRKSN